MTTKTDANTKTDAQPAAPTPAEDEALAEAAAGTGGEADAAAPAGSDADTRAEARDEDEAHAEDDAEEAADELADSGDVTAPESAGVGQGAAAIVSAALGFLSLSGSWIGTIVSARETLTGQLNLSTNANPGVAAQVKEGYTDGWHATAAVGGFFALLALVVAVVVLARPAFGAPGRPQAAWIKSAAWAGVSLGVIGLILAVAKYTDLIFGTPGLS
ncbi:hypothetical protein ACFW9D_18600 [Streptomyces sp. NPDC059524]|uniref:hypothetical protein n=1 Tax=Streptomyces sp. NPDC059524 TaxID=3346856 RepID=UPI0036B132E8